MNFMIIQFEAMFMRHALFSFACLYSICITSIFPITSKYIRVLVPVHTVELFGTVNLLNVYTSINDKLA